MERRRVERIKTLLAELSDRNTALTELHDTPFRWCVGSAGEGLAAGPSSGPRSSAQPESVPCQHHRSRRRRRCNDSRRRTTRPRDGSGSIQARPGATGSSMSFRPSVRRGHAPCQRGWSKTRRRCNSRSSRRTPRPAHCRPLPAGSAWAARSTPRRTPPARWRTRPEQREPRFSACVTRTYTLAREQARCHRDPPGTRPAYRQICRGPDVGPAPALRIRPLRFRRALETNGWRTRVRPASQYCDRPRGRRGAVRAHASCATRARQSFTGVSGWMAGAPSMASAAT